MLTREQISAYFENGYLLVEDVVTPERLQRMQDITHDFIDQSRHVTESNEVYDLDEGHGSENPKLTRIKLPHKQHPLFWDVLKNSGITEVLRQLVGPNAVLQTSKLNAKAPGGGAAVEWHQDWAFYPHTNDDMLAFGVFLEDVTEDNGPLQVIPGSHKGPILDHNSTQGVFCGAVDPSDPEFQRDQAVTITGKAGSMSVHHARTLHGSAPNVSDRARLMLFYECCAADAWPLMGGSAYIHVAYLVIDGVIDTEDTRISFAPKEPDDFFMDPKSIAETALMLVGQHKSAWSFELDLRPFGEKW